MAELRSVFQRLGDAQHPFLVKGTADDLQAERQSARIEAAE